ncbi:MAG: RsmE family RNA methyltransferase [Myxococcota bacterium]
MTTRRLHVPTLPPSGGVVALGEASARHVRVLRMEPGDILVLFDGQGAEAEARIESLDGGTVQCLADPPTQSRTRTTHIGLMLAVPKGSKLEGCVRMATELGVDEIALLETERTVPRWAPSRSQARIDRLTRVAIEAASQSERADVPILAEPVSCDVAMARVSRGAYGVVFAARADTPLATFAAPPPSVWCAIGPEGGFTDRELARFQEHGFVPASLGSLVLRVETAVPAALSLVRDRVDGFGQVR